MVTKPAHPPDPEAKVNAIMSQWWERRGTLVYGEDEGPGTAQFVAEYATVEEAQRAVDEHNAALEG